MDDNRFFRLLGRVNAVLLFFVIVGIGLFAGSMVLQIFSGERGAVPPAAVQTQGGDTYEFGGNIGLDAASSSALTRLDGTEEGFMVLERESNERRGSFSSGYGGGSRNVNLLLFDLRTMRNRWLFPGVKQDIEQSYAIHAVVPVPQQAGDPVTALLMPVATADTNGDGKIDGRDDHALYAYRPGSAAAAKLFDARSVTTLEQIDSDRVLVTYYDGKTDRAAMLSAKDFTVIAQAAVSPNPH